MILVCHPNLLPRLLFLLFQNIPTQKEKEQEWIRIYQNLHTIQRKRNPRSGHARWMQNVQRNDQLKTLQKDFETQLKNVEIASLKICRMFLPREEDVQDCLQSAKQRAWEYYYSFEEQYQGAEQNTQIAFRNWFLAILKNVVRTYLRKKMRQPTLSLDLMCQTYDVVEWENYFHPIHRLQEEYEEGEDFIVSHEDEYAQINAPDPVHLKTHNRFAMQVHQIETEDYFLHLISDWTEPERRLCILHFLYGYTPEEIALEEGWELPRLKQTLQLLRTRLQQRWLQKEEWEDA